MQIITIKPQDYNIDKYGNILKLDGSRLMLGANKQNLYHIETIGLAYFLVFCYINNMQSDVSYRILASKRNYWSRLYIKLLTFALLLERYFRGSDTQSKVIFNLNRMQKNLNAQPVYISSWLKALDYINSHYSEAIETTYIIP